MTAVLAANAADEALKPFIILPTLVNLPEELKELQPQYIFYSSPSGWMTSKIILIWSIFFAAEVNERRKKLVASLGNLAYTKLCFLFLDGRKSRLNTYAIEILFRNNIRVLVLPAHSSHITQPFDVGLESQLKHYFINLSQEMSKWIENKLQDFSDTTKKRYQRVLSIIDAWKRSAIDHNIHSVWYKTGLFPTNVEIVKASSYVLASSQDGTTEEEPPKCKVPINGMEITTFSKRLEISKHFTNIPYLFIPVQIPSANFISSLIRTGKEKLLSVDCYFYLNLGYGYGYYKLSK